MWTPTFHIHHLKTFIPHKSLLEKEEFMDIYNQNLPPSSLFLCLDSILTSLEKTLSHNIAKNEKHYWRLWKDWINNKGVWSRFCYAMPKKRESSISAVYVDGGISTNLVDVISQTWDFYRNLFAQNDDPQLIGRDEELENVLKEVLGVYEV